MLWWWRAREGLSEETAYDQRPQAYDKKEAPTGKSGGQNIPVRGNGRGNPMFCASRIRKWTTVPGPK